MKQGGLKFIAALIATMMVVVPFIGIDSLPRDLKKQIAAERTALTESLSKVRGATAEVGRELSQESDLFRGVPASQRWPNQLNDAVTNLQTATSEMEQLTALEKANRRQDRERAQALLAQEKRRRISAENRAAEIRKEATHWVDLKRRLPEVLAQMDRDYQTIHGFDFGAATAAVQKAAADWPDKKPDLDNRLAALKASGNEAESLWQSTAETRRQAAANNLAGLNFATLGTVSDTLRASAQDLPAKATALATLTGQLYTSWDKLLVDMRERKGDHEQQIRTVTTKDGKTTSDDKWVTVSSAQYRAMQNNLGMAIEHKSTGKYDSEADRVAQPAGFAYMAPPGQRNQYGYWENRGGQDTWVWVAQYLIMRDLLFNRDYRPIDRGDWDSYRSQQSRGETYYGRERGTDAPKYGTAAPRTQERYSGSSYSQSGGFKDSKYATKPGGYADSQYASPSSRQGSDSNPRSFGSGSSRREEPRAVPAPSRPRSSPSMPRSAPRRFGKR
jgi:hypothetical protein